jgi:hypothetical protein
VPMKIYLLIWDPSTTAETYATCATTLEFQQLYNVAPNYIGVQSVQTVVFTLTYHNLEILAVRMALGRSKVQVIQPK